MWKTAPSSEIKRNIVAEKFPNVAFNFLLRKFKIYFTNMPCSEVDMGSMRIHKWQIKNQKLSEERE